MVTNGVISRLTIVITHVRGLITLLTTSHEPPSRAQHRCSKANIRPLCLVWQVDHDVLPVPAVKHGSDLCKALLLRLEVGSFRLSDLPPIDRSDHS